MWHDNNIQSNKIAISLFKFGKTFNFHNVLYLRSLNYANQLSAAKNSLECKKMYTQTWKYQFLEETQNKRGIQKIEKRNLIRNNIIVIINIM